MPELRALWQLFIELSCVVMFSKQMRKQQNCASSQKIVFVTSMLPLPMSFLNREKEDIDVWSLIQMANRHPRKYPAARAGCWRPLYCS